MDDGLYFALTFLRAAVPVLCLASLVSSFIGSLFARLFSSLQARGFGAESTEDEPASTPAVERRPLLDENGIAPVVVREKSRRSWLLITLFCLIALSYAADGVVLIADAVIEREWETETPLFHLLDFYIVGSFLAFALMALAMSWQRIKGRRGPAERATPVVLAGLATAGEVSMLGVMAALYRDVFRGHIPLYPALHLAILVVRLFHLLFLLLSFTPLLQRSTFKPPALTNGSSYGTFAANAKADEPTTDKPVAPVPPDASFATLMHRIRVLAPYLWPKKSVLLQVIAGTCFAILVVGRIINPLVPAQLGAVVEDLRTERSPWKNLGVYVGLKFMQGSGGILSVLQNNLWISVSQYSDREMSMMTFEHLLNLSLAYHTRRKTGEVLRVLDRGSAINNFFQMILFNIFPIVADISIAIVVFAFKFGPLLSFTVAIIMIAYVATSVILTQYRVKLRRAMNDKDKYCRSIHTDTLLSWEVVKYFTAESYELKRYRAALRDYQKTEYEVIASLNFLNLVQNFITTLGLLIGSMIVAYDVTRGLRNPGVFVEWITYLAQLNGPLNSLGTLYRVIQSNLIDTDNLMKLLNEQKEVVDKEDAFELLKAEGEIVFDNVSFSYDGRVQALQDVSFRIPAGTSAAFVGESGGGKSTILRLLYRFYDIQSGSITVDGHDVRDITQLSLRRQIGVVPQDAVLFNESIRYNISYGDPQAPAESVEAAAKAAQIHERILTFPDGYETKVGERGVRLSGGEKQRVSIARTVLKNPPILMLDEATSALDTTTEREIQAALKNLAKGRTSLSIAHRLSSVVSADIIFVIHAGRIVESGSHAELLAKEGVFAQLWADQIKAEVEGMPADKPANTGLAPVPKDASSGATTPAHLH